MNNDSLAECVKVIKKYSRVLVLGPQRSGTNIAAKILAHESGYPLFSERQFGESSCVIDKPPTHSEKLEDFMQTEPSYVLQSPVLTYTAQTLDVSDAIVCFISRPILEIEDSRTSSDWPGAEREWRKYQASFPEMTEDLSAVNLATVQVKTWKEIQKEQMKLPFIELTFSDLQNHPLWVQKTERGSFAIGQTEKAAD